MLYANCLAILVTTCWVFLLDIATQLSLMASVGDQDQLFKPRVFLTNTVQPLATTDSAAGKFIFTQSALPGHWSAISSQITISMSQAQLLCLRPISKCSYNSSI